MERYKNLKITDYTCNGKCSNCGNCCGDILHLSKREIKEIDNYLKKHKIEFTPKNIMFVYDNTCPFRDNEKKICKIYEVRPIICKVYQCDKSPEEAYKRREINNEIRLPRSMRQLFFNDNEGAIWFKNNIGRSVYDRKNKEVL